MSKFNVKTRPYHVSKALLILNIARQFVHQCADFDFIRKTFNFVKSLFANIVTTYRKSVKTARFSQTLKAFNIFYFS